MHLQVLFIPTCAACTATAQLPARLQAETLGLQLEPVPLADHPELAARSGLLSFEYALLSAHAVVIDGELAAIGHPTEALRSGWLSPHTFTLHPRT